MEICNGWLYFTDTEKKREKNILAYQELLKANKFEELWKQDEPAVTHYKIKATRIFKPIEMLLWADNGNLCYGGHFNNNENLEQLLNPGIYECSIYTD